MLLTSMPIAFAAGDIEPGPGEFALTIKELAKTSTSGFTAKITKGEGEKEVPLVGVTTKENGVEAKTYAGMVIGIANGEYTLTVSAPNYATYTQNFNVKDNRVNITLYNELSVNYGRYEIKEGKYVGKTYTEGGQEKTYGLFGVIALGDVDKDQKVTKADADKITENIGATDAAAVESYDLSGDGKVDMVDLTYVTRNIASGSLSSNIEATPVKSVSSTYISSKSVVTAGKNTNASAKVAQEQPDGSVQYVEQPGKDIKDVLLSEAGDSVVSLAPASGTISEENAANLDLVLDKDDLENTDPKQVIENAPKMQAITIVPPVDSGNKITAGELTVDGVDVATEQNVTITAPLGEQSVPAKVSAIAAAGEPQTKQGSTEVESDGTIVVDLGDQVAVKKVSIRVTGTSSGELADIAKVEFLEDFASRIPEPKLSIPEIIEGSISNSEGEYKSLTFSWTRQDNVTGYEVCINGPGVSNLYRTTDATTYTFQSDKNVAVLQTYGTYTLKVRSFSGEWKSAWSNEVKYEVTCTSRPSAPEQLSATGGANRITLTWRALYDTNAWTVYYRNITKNEEQYTASERLSTPSFVLDNLNGGDECEFYVVGHNRVGDSPNSPTARGVALSPEGVKLPQYALINTDNENGQALNHIESITFIRRDRITVYGKGDPIAEDNIPQEVLQEVITDHKPSTYFVTSDWDNGYSYDGTDAQGIDSLRGPIVKLDQKTMIDTICIAPRDGATVHMNNAKIGYTDSDGNKQRVKANVVIKQDDQGRTYYELNAVAPVLTDTFEIRFSGSGGMSVSEIALYNYVSAYNDAKALFTDASMVELADPANAQQKIDEIRTFINTPDEHGNYYVKKDATEIILQQAETLIKHNDLDKPIRVHTEITPTADGNNHFALPVSEFQPLGYVAAAGDTVMVYVGDDRGSAVNSKTSLFLVSTQYHSESNKWQQLSNLHIGLNEVVIPSLTSNTVEKGGALYVAYESGRTTENDYIVRVKGATAIPKLDVSSLNLNAPEYAGKTDKTALRAELIKNYLDDLKAYVGNNGDGIKAKHDQLHAASESPSLQGIEYNIEKCFLNSTEIVTDYAVFSFPATQVLAGIQAGAKNKSITDEAQLEDATRAIDQELELFYQFKGLHKTNDMSDVDRIPQCRQNIRYMTMFTGAFMYAGGKHIGIGYGSVPGLFGTTPIKLNAEGKYESGGYSGWGIAHEIGHVINSKDYVVTEVTNNLFAQLAQIYDGKDVRTAEQKSKEQDIEFSPNYNFRNSYTGKDGIYSKVLGNNTGNVAGLGDQLGFFWQLHLAYDNDYVYKIYDTPEEQLAHIFYARVDSIYRKVDKYNASREDLAIPLNLNGGAVDNFMRVVVAASNKNCLDFFRAWGMTPNEDTVNFANQFDPEPRKIQYVDDTSYYYAIENKTSVAEGTTVTANISNAEDKRINGNTVEITITNSASDQKAMLGYEIARNGKIVAFVPVDKSGTTVYNDVIATENNKSFIYTVTGVDHMLKATETATCQEVKVCHDGAIDKSNWKVAETTLYSDDDIVIEAGDETADVYSCESIREPNFDKMFDGNKDTFYRGQASYTDKGVVHKTGDPSFKIDFGKVEQVTAIKINPGAEADAVKSFEVLLSEDNSTYEPVAKVDNLANAVGSPDKDGAYTFYFNKDDKPYMMVYDARYVMININGDSETHSIAELDILGPTNDNVELEHSGYLQTEYSYGSREDQKIPADAVTFYGTYKGDPSYNIVLLKDANGNIISGDQIILAKVAPNGKLGEVSNGAWIYWLVNPDTEQAITRDTLDSFVEEYNGKYGVKYDFSSVQAELYRVQDAINLTGQRLTSTSLHEALTKDTALELSSDPTVTEGQKGYSEAPPTLAGTENSISAVSSAYTVSSKEAAKYAPVKTIETSATGYVATAVDAVNIVVDDTDANGQTGFARATINPVSNPYALHFTVNLSLEGVAGSVENDSTDVRIEEVQFPEEVNDQTVYYGYKLNSDGRRADVYAATMANGIQSPVVCDVIANEEPFLAENYKGKQVMEFNINGFDTITSMYVKGTDVGEGLSSSDGKEYECRQHEFKTVTASEPTCTTPGYKIEECIYCGATNETTVSEPLGHNFGPYETVTPPTCEEDGLERAKCLNDGCTETLERPIPATGHKDLDNDGRCDTCGKAFNFRCRLCDKNDELKDVPVIGVIFSIFHSIFHLFSRIIYVFRGGK